MPIYQLRIQVELLGPDADPKFEEAHGDGESAEATMNGDVWNPTPIVRANGAAGILQLVLTSLRNREITPGACTRLLARLHP